MDRTASLNSLSDSFFLETLNRIFDPVPVPIILVDHNGKVVMINEVFADYLNRSKEEVLGRHVQEIDRNTRFPFVLQKKEAEIAWRHRFENGHTAIVHRIPVLDDHGNVLYGFGMVLFQDIEEFKEIIKKNKQLDSEIFHIRNELKKIQGAKYSWENIIGNSAKMLQAKYMGKKAALTNSNVLLLGESGTGKELFAHAIHGDSGRSYYPLVKVNCAAIPKELLESEMFGYEEGAFTGAKRGGKIGKFELANNGTLFLDEIGELPLDMQAKLLRVLQEREFERVGGNETVRVDARIIAATNLNLEEEVEAGRFRADLYYRLNVMNIQIPALKERMDDLPALVNKLISKLSEALGKYIIGTTTEFMNVLSAYSWPGNVRELENVLERAINMSENDTLTVSSLPVYLLKPSDKATYTSVKPLKEVVENIEKQLIEEALEYTGGNKKKAADLLKIGRSSLYEKIEKYNIH